jgi:putative heme degradation protein
MSAEPVVGVGSGPDVLEWAAGLLAAVADAQREREPVERLRPVPAQAPAAPRLLFRYRDAAAQLGIGETKLRELEARGWFRAVRIDGAVRIPYEELEGIVARLKREQWDMRPQGGGPR